MACRKGPPAAWKTTASGAASSSCRSSIATSTSSSARLATVPVHDELRLRRLKKKKLQLKDEILQLQYRLVPDIPA